METCKLYSTLQNDGYEATRAIVSGKAIADNYLTLLSAVHKISPSSEGICVVKADAYGHTNEICAPALAEVGCRRFAVSSVAEAVALRNILDGAGYPDVFILILGYTAPEHACLLTKHRITQCVFSGEYAKALNSAADGVIDIHIKLDTGMNRLGFRAQSQDEVISAADEIFEVSKLVNLNITGMFTHFSCADCLTAKGDGYTFAQYNNFMSVDSELRTRGVEIAFRHVCNSAGAIRFPELALEGVRFGIVLYGGATDVSELDGLKPVMRLESRISHIHTMKKGDSAGYGAEFTAERETRLITVPIGYADGLFRRYTGAFVKIITKSGECEVRIVGRICMDQCLIDATGTDADVGDRVVFFGDKRERLSDLAKLADTIDYEILCGISARVPRISE